MGRAAVGLGLGRVGAAGSDAARVGRVGFFHREFFGFTGHRQPRDRAEDYSKFSITRPQDSRLPDGGGYPVGPDLRPQRAVALRRDRNYVTYSDSYGDQYQKFNGIDMTFNARPGNGITVQGGFSGGYATSDNCEIREKVPEIALLNPFCHVETTFMPQYKGLGSYIVPKVDVQISATFTSKPGINVSGFGTPQQGARLPRTTPCRTPWWRRSSGAPWRQRLEHHGQHSGALRGARRAGERARRAVPEDPAVREDPGQRRRGHLQRPELQRRPELQPGVHPNGAWLDPTSILSARFAKFQRAIRLLRTWRRRRRRGQRKQRGNGKSERSPISALSRPTLPTPPLRQSFLPPHQWLRFLTAQRTGP
jgi:hypothetical protein